MSGEAVWVLGHTPPVFSIGYEAPDEKDASWDSGFTVLFDDAPEPEDVDDILRQPESRSWCLHCLLNEHPEIGRGFDLAREFGAADLDEDGEWRGRQARPAR